MNMREAALSYAEQGWNVFPVRPNKKPYTKHGYLEATTNKAKIGEWWDEWPDANIGFSPGDAELLVFDIDPGATIDTLNKALDGYLPDTELAARTPRGGHHLYFKLNDQEQVRPSASQVAKHIDVRSSGSYVLLPPSRTDAGEYTWIGEHGSKARPARRTDAMIEVVGRKRERSEQADQWLVMPDEPANISACISWLENTAEAAVEGQGGDLMTYKTAAMCRSYGISEQKALDLIWDHWNERCAPPWDYDDLAVKVGNAYQFPTSPAGNVTPEGKAKLLGMERVTEVLEDDDGAVTLNFKNPGMRGVNRAAMNKIPDPTWLIDDLMPAGGYAIMYAPWSSFKTFVALDMALTVACEDPIGTVHKADTHGPVLFFAGEGRSNLLSRVRAWELEHNAGLPVENFWLFDPAPKVTEDYTAVYDAMMSRYPDGIKLVVIDTISRSLQGENENTQEIATRFTAMQETINRSLGGDCAVLAIHHTGKSDQMRGSTAFGGDVDALYRVKRTDDEAMFAVLDQEKIKDGVPWTKPRLISMKAIRDTLVAVEATTDHRAMFETQGSNKKVADDLIVDIIIETCRARPGHLFSQNKMAEAIAEHPDCEAKVGTIRPRLKALREGGWMDRIQPYLSGTSFIYEA